MEEKLRRSEWTVRPISIKTARRIVESYHYAASATNTRVYTHGIFRVQDMDDDMCLGAAWWLPPTKNAAMATFPEGDWRKVLSLTRLAISPEVPKNGASFLLGRSIKMIDSDKWHCLVTYADTWQMHTGGIYRATNWEYLGITRPSPVFQSGDGRVMGRKRGGKNLTVDELAAEGFHKIGNFSKHKFRMILRRQR